MSGGDRCRDAMVALRTAPAASAQALAANTIDSVVRSAAQSYFFAKTALATPPGIRKSLPTNFSPHVTAHAVGEPGAYSPIFAPSAVMLATSLRLGFRW